MAKAKRTVGQQIAWWWSTRIRSWWTVFLPGLRERRTAQQGIFEFSRCPGPLSDGHNGQATVILTAYKRREYLPMQVEALRAQTCPPAEIWVWCNDNESVADDFSGLVDRVIISNANWKFWGRFALANMVRTPFVCILDDDILPQPKWIENCLETLEAGHDGILGGSGVILPESGGYSSKVKVGWNGHHYEHVAEVDLVGHAWFFRKAHLQYMWREEPASWENGEDIHFSYMALKHGGIKTLVPPHPEGEPEKWSCRPDFGKRVGRHSTATHKAEDHHSVRSAVVDAYRRDGWSIVASREMKTDSA
jgi:hypothetical protein